MVAGTQSCGDQCYDFFLEPFNQGRCNIRDAIAGKNQEWTNFVDALTGKTTTVAQNAINGAAQNAPQGDTDLSIAQKISKIAIGIILWIPVINHIVMTILKAAGSDFVYKVPGQAQTVRPTPGTAPGAGGPDPFAVPDNFIIEDIAEEPIPQLTEEQKNALKAAAAVRFGEIEQMLPVRPAPDPQNGAAVRAFYENSAADLARHFDCTDAVIQFDLNAILQRYRTNQRASELLELMDWAGVPENQNRNLFRAAIGRYGIANPGDERAVLIEGLLRNLVAYFSHFRPRVEARVAAARAAVGDPFALQNAEAAENALKTQFTTVFRTLINANENCIDQMLGQVQTLALEVLAEGVTNQGSATQRKLIAQAGLALCRYRTNLVKQIVHDQNPRYAHMADLERIVMQRITPMLGIRGDIFAAGAAYAGIVNNADQRVQQAADTFWRHWNPEQFLLTQLSDHTLATGDAESLRNEIMIWARNRYELGDGNVNDIDQRITRVGENLPASEGGSLKPQAIALFMEELGFIRQRAVPRDPPVPAGAANG